MKKAKAVVDVWNGCYPSNWSGMIVPEAMKHPAKFSSKLIRRIYQHMLEEHWLRPGDYVLDPFGGVALGALDAMRAGLRWRGVELEERFVTLGGMNISFWKKRFQTMPGWSGDAILFHGDSRKLLEVIFKAQGVVSSPPYAEARIGRESGKGQAGHGDQYGDTEGQLGAMPAQNFDAAIASPPFRQASGGAGVPRKPGGVIDAAAVQRHVAGNMSSHGYGETGGQLANMREGDFEATISSPPYEGRDVPYADRDYSNLQAHLEKKHKRTMAKSAELLGSGGYGKTDGQLGIMRGDGFETVITSPPYEGGGHHKHQMDSYNKNGGGQFEKQNSGYGEGDAFADDFWLAARIVIEQVYLALTPGGHAVWVCKDFVQNHERVPFCDRWRQLCEAVGFVTVHEHHASLVHHKGSSQTLEGGTIHHKTESKSLFRRIAENKGAPKIDYEVVFCMVKPAS
jgi:hypothetical protein